MCTVNVHTVYIHLKTGLGGGGPLPGFYTGLPAPRPALCDIFLLDHSFVRPVVRHTVSLVATAPARNSPTSHSCVSSTVYSSTLYSLDFVKFISKPDGNIA